MEFCVAVAGGNHGGRRGDLVGAAGTQKRGDADLHSCQARGIVDEDFAVHVHNETNSEAELFRKVPDIDKLDSFDMNDESVILTLRGIGEMTPAPNATAMNRVDLVVVPSGTQAAPTHKAQVTLLPSSTYDLLWKDMGSATDEIASILSGNSSYDVLIVPWQPLRTWLHRTSESLTQGRCLL